MKGDCHIFAGWIASARHAVDESAMVLITICSRPEDHNEWKIICRSWPCFPTVSRSLGRWTWSIRILSLPSPIGIWLTSPDSSQHFGSGQRKHVFINIIHFFYSVEQPRVPVKVNKCWKVNSSGVYFGDAEETFKLNNFFKVNFRCVWSLIFQVFWFSFNLNIFLVWSPTKLGVPCWEDDAPINWKLISAGVWSVAILQSVLPTRGFRKLWSVPLLWPKPVWFPRTSSAIPACSLFGKDKNNCEINRVSQRLFH